MRVRGIAFVSLLALLALPGCTREREPLRVTVVGVDGADWQVIDPLLEQGELPNFARLIATGVRGPFQSELPLNSPPIWTTVATGVSRDRHGILSFRKNRRLVSSRDRQVPALWTIASTIGLRSAVIGWWATFPAEPVDGAMISERALKTREADITAMFRGRLEEADPGRLTHPPEVLSMLQSIFARKPGPEPDAPEPRKVKRNMRIEDSASVEALLELRHERGPFDLEMVLLRGVDPVSHFFWWFHEPDATFYSRPPSPKRVAEVGDTVRAHYRFVDDLIGKLRADDPERVILVISDHGFEAGRQKFRGGWTLTGTHKSEAASTGIFIASGGPVLHSGRVEDIGIYDIAPLVLYLLDAPIAEDLEGTIPAGVLDPTWTREQEPKAVAQYDFAASSLPPDGGADESSPADEALLEELEALGYIE